MAGVQKQPQNPSLTGEAKKLFLESPVIEEKNKNKTTKPRSDVAGPTNSPCCSRLGLETEIHAGFGVNLVIWFLLQSKKGLIQPISHKTKGIIAGNT